MCRSPLRMATRFSLTRRPEKHALVAMGDSLALGFQNGGIFRSDLSFPAMIARSMDPQPAFETPSFVMQGGIPLNLDVLVRGLEERFGPEISWNESMAAATYLFTTLRRIKQHWEGRKRPLAVRRERPWHLQAVWGFAMNDAWMMTERHAREFIETQRNSYSVFSVLPDHAMYTTARMVLNPAFRDDLADRCMLDNVEWFARDGGIENLICCLGHNNVVRATSDLRIRYSEAGDLGAYHAQRRCTVYRPEHFRQEAHVLFEKLAAMRIRRVFVPTLPLVTIPPVMRGVNPDGSPPREGLYDYYTRFWIWDEDFDPERHPHLTRGQAVELDTLVRDYNAILAELARRYGFHLVPVSKFVEAAARRRKRHNRQRHRRIDGLFPPGLVQALQAHEATRHLDPDHPLTTDFFRLDPASGLMDRGGIFSLDGLHPSTVGYGLIADIYRRTMQKAGVRFARDLDWPGIVAEDTLLSRPPALLVNLRDVLQFLGMDRNEMLTRLGKGVLEQLLELVGSGDSAAAALQSTLRPDQGPGPGQGASGGE